MKLIHLSDLHLGKTVNSYSMLEDQEYILQQILGIVDAEQPDGILIAGDVYDKSIPPTEAVSCLDRFLVDLAKRRQQVFLINGNHDSAERVAFGGRLMDLSGIHFAPVYSGPVSPFTLTDRFGPVQIWLLPFLKPVHVKKAFPEQEDTIHTYTDAMAAAIAAMNPDPGVRNVLVAHQFVTGAVRCDSEDISIGGLDNVDVSVFDAFDYVALGHLHGPQHVGRETVRYCGTPLKYSFSEVHQKKSVTVVELEEKGSSISIREIPLTPLRDWVELRGTFDELNSPAYCLAHCRKEDYVRIVLTDEEDILEAKPRLQMIYEKLMILDYDNKRTQASAVIDSGGDIRQKSPLELLDEFYEKQNGQGMNPEQRAYAGKIMEEIWEGAS